MATDSASSSLCSSEEKTNGFKLMRLIIDGGTEALRDLFQRKHSGDLQTVLGTYRSKLQSLGKIITPPQWKKLYPRGAVSPNIKEFDITLLFLLLRNICGISAPIGTGWDSMPMDTDDSEEANIVRIKLFRNKYVGHIPDTGISTTEFEARWKEVSTTLIDLGISRIHIDLLKDEECGQEEVDRIREEWSENDAKVGLHLLGIKKMLKQVNERLDNVESDVKSMKPDKHDVLNKHLNWCDFSKDIELLYQKWCKDTREWVFDQVSEWFNDTKSENRAFIITGQPGMGKSVIAAVICKRYAKQLAACHFCLYNNDRYNDPKTLLKSLARQLSNVVSDYEKALIEKLSGKEGQKLEDMNIQALFSVLFKEPLRDIDVAERYLIVIDAVDESDRKGKIALVDLIADYLGRLPSFIRFLITTRPENNIAEKFEKLNPMFLSPKDEQNVKDIQRLFEEKLSQAKAKHISSLVEKSNGSMLFASCILKFIDDYSVNLDADDLPTGVKEIYTSYFKRWEEEFQNEEVGEDEFLSFLGIMAVAKEPLPEKLVAKVFESKTNSPASAKRKMNKIKNCLSLFLVIHLGRLTLFHKSVKDWLVDCEHVFQVNEKFGNETLANICAREMDELKKKKINPPFHPAAEYALRFGTQHILSGVQGELVKSFIDRYVTDLEIMYASVSVDVYATLNNFRSLKNDIIYSSVSEKARRTIETFMFLIRKYSNTFQDFPQSFLQHVLNWGGEDLSSKAASLLNYRYKDLVYFERTQKDHLENALECRICRSAEIAGLAISPKEDYLVCWYDDGKIELFSIEDFKSLWTIENDDLIQSHLQHISSDWRMVVASIIAFHPLENVILPGRLDSVINLQGAFEPGPFSCNDINRLFDNCCFSNDNSKMVTTYGNELTVWNLERSESLQSFSCDYDLLSVSFSANGRFLATSDKGKGVVVYDLERDYISVSKSFHKEIQFLSTFKSDSWYCRDLFELYTVRPDLSALDPVARDYYGRPLNAKAAAEFEDFFHNPHFSGEREWFNTTSNCSFSFFCFNTGIALVWANYLPEVGFYSISKLKQPRSVRNYPDISRDANINISLDGKLLYIAESNCFWLYKLDSNYSFQFLLNIKWSDIAFVPVTNAVFFCGKPGESRDCFASHRFQTGIPELWSSDLKQQLGSFYELSGTKQCLAVSEEVVACIKTDQLVCFFSVVERKIVSKTLVPQDMEVKACSSKYHVLTVNNFSPSLWREGKVVAALAGAVLESGSSRTKYTFSPSSEKLAHIIDECEGVYIFDVALARLRHKVAFGFVGEIIAEENILKFLDEDRLLCKVYKTSVCIINASSGNALSCVNIGDEPQSLCLSRKPDNSSVLVCFKTWTRKIKLIKVWLPR